MRFLYKRPNIKDVSAELELVLDVLMSDFFIIVDLFWVSLIFTIFLFPMLPSMFIAFLFFTGSYLFFICLYMFLFKQPEKKNKLHSK